MGGGAARVSSERRRDQAPARRRGEVQSRVSAASTSAPASAGSCRWRRLRRGHARGNNVEREGVTKAGGGRPAVCLGPFGTSLWWWGLTPRFVPHGRIRPRELGNGGYGTHLKGGGGGRFCPRSALSRSFGRSYRRRHRQPTPGGSPDARVATCQQFPA